MAGKWKTKDTRSRLLMNESAIEWMNECNDSFIKHSTVNKALTPGWESVFGIQGFGGQGRPSGGAA